MLSIIPLLYFTFIQQAWQALRFSLKSIRLLLRERIHVLSIRAQQDSVNLTG